MTKRRSLRAEGVAISVEGMLSGIASSLMLLAMTRRAAAPRNERGTTGISSQLRVDDILILRNVTYLSELAHTAGIENIDFPYYSLFVIISYCAIL